MEISLRHYGKSRDKSSTIIEMIVVSNGTILVEDITNLKGIVNESLISDLRNIADELEEQNILINQLKLTP